MEKLIFNQIFTHLYQGPFSATVTPVAQRLSVLANPWLLWGCLSSSVVQGLHLHLHLHLRPFASCHPSCLSHPVSC